jgi:sialate O-acetylesterase
MKFAALCATLLLAASASAHSEVKPANIISDHMVLQSGMSVPIWGTADPSEKVTVTLAGQTKSAAADATGKWTVRLLNLKSGGPYEMTIAGAGESPLTIHDVLVGEVWLGSGQSNMQFTVSRAHAGYAGLLDETKEIAAANYPQLRMYTVKPTTDIALQADVPGAWQVCTPDVVGDWSAVGYLFGRNLNQTLKVPVGIVLSAFGASTAEAWIPREALLADPTLAPMVTQLDARYNFFKQHPGGTDAGAPPEPMMLNARLPAPGSPALPLRDPEHNQHQPTVLWNAMINPILPYAIRGAIWYQGESIGGGPAGLMNYGHVMQTLITTWRSKWGEGNFPFFEVQLPALKNVSNNPLVREQQAEILSLPNTAIAVTVDIGDPANVHPKNKEPLGHRLELLALADAYGRKNIESSGPVYSSMKVKGNAIQINFTHATGLKSAPTPNQLAGLTWPDAPARPAAPPVPPPTTANNNMPNTGTPTPAATAGAPAARGPRGPRNQGPPPPVEVSAPPDPAVLADASAHLRGFQIAGADQNFVDADAKIVGDSVVVSSPQVASPVAVRYAWDNYPVTANLYNAANLPAAPFRTDKWDAMPAIAAQFTIK